MKLKDTMIYRNLFQQMYNPCKKLKQGMFCFRTTNLSDVIFYLLPSGLIEKVECLKDDLGSDKVEVQVIKK